MLRSSQTALKMGTEHVLNVTRGKTGRHSKMLPVSGL